MANLIPIGLDSTTGQQKVLDTTVDTMQLGTNDFTFSTYTGGDIDIGTTDDGGWVDVDATNAALTINVTAGGLFIASFNFSIHMEGTSGNNLTSTTIFRLTDGTTPILPSGVSCQIPGATSFSSSIVSTCIIQGTFQFSSVGSQTVKLQKQNLASTNVSIRSVVANSFSALKMVAFKIAE